MQSALRAVSTALAAGEITPLEAQALASMIDCYRDPSVLQFVGISASDAWNNVKKGKLGAAAGNVFDRRNLISLQAVWEGRNWIGKV